MSDNDKELRITFKCTKKGKKAVLTIESDEILDTQDLETAINEIIQIHSEPSAEKSSQH